MNELVKEFESVLDEENKLLDVLVVKQAELRKAVTEKNWEVLTEVISDINKVSDTFQEYDLTRDKIQVQLKTDELKPCFDKIGTVRSKLLKCKIENKVLSDYVNIAKTFVQEVVDKAIPQTRNKNYSRNGKIVQPQVQSVVLNQLF